MEMLDRIRPLLEGMGPDERAAALAWIRDDVARRRLVAEFAGPAELAASVDASYRITSAVKVMSDALEAAALRPGGRVMVTVPPQTVGKSVLASVWLPIRMLQRDPRLRIMVASYSGDLAAEHARTARNLIASYGSDARDPLTGARMPDRLGLALADDKSSAAHWRVRGHGGGMVAVGFGGTISGRSADMLVIDDPLKGIREADSEAERRKVVDSFRADLSTRLSPGAPILLASTRWHEDDLAGWLMRNEPGRWEVVNIPALSQEGVPDALGRPPGVWIEHPRGRSDVEWQQVRETAGERVFSALYQGQPTPASGGLFSGAWFADHRVRELPEIVSTVVGVDPAETGQNDEAGIIAASLDRDGHVILTHDRSGHMTSDEWARAAVDLAVETSAREIAFEAYSAGDTYRRVIVDTYRRLQADRGWPVDPRFTVRPWRGKGDAVARSSLLRLSLIHISEPTRQPSSSRMPSSA